MPAAASLDEGLDALLAGASRIAMEYSPGGDIPYLSRVDAGTLESVRQRGVEVVSSGDLVQQFEAVWTPEQIATHEAASAALYRIKDRAFDVLRGRSPAAASAPPSTPCSSRWSAGLPTRDSSARTRRWWR